MKSGECVMNRPPQAAFARGVPRPGVGVGTRASHGLHVSMPDCLPDGTPRPLPPSSTGSLSSSGQPVGAPRWDGGWGMRVRYGTVRRHEGNCGGRIKKCGVFQVNTQHTYVHTYISLHNYVVYYLRTNVYAYMTSNR